VDIPSKPDSLASTRFQYQLAPDASMGKQPSDAKLYLSFRRLSQEIPEQCRWQKTNPPELPYPRDTKAYSLINRFGDIPPNVWETDS